MITRRTLLATTAAAAILPRFAKADDTLAGAMAESRLIYLTPLQSSGAESRCQAEIWVRAARERHCTWSRPPMPGGQRPFAAA